MPSPSATTIIKTHVGNAPNKVHSRCKFYIDNNGTVNLDCDGMINLSGLVVKSGGTPNATGKKLFLAQVLKSNPAEAKSTSDIRIDFITPHNNI